MKRKITILLILSLLLMALPFGNALAAGVQENSCVNRTVLIKQICSADRTSDLYSQVLQALKGRNVQAMSLSELRALINSISGSNQATVRPTAVPTAVPTTAPTAAPTTAPTAAPTVRPTATAAPTTSPAGNLSALEQQMIDLVNADRAANGLPALTYDAGLTAGARKHSQDMSENNYFSHTSPTYGSFSARIQASGVSYRTAGENIALYNNVEKAEAALMNSEGHRANILNSSFTRIGIGIVWNQAKGAYYITQWFAG